MPRLRRLLLIVLTEHVATILIERGIYFYTDERLGFTPTENLWLAFGFGVAYVLGALSSHRLAVRWGEKRLFVGIVVAELALHGLLVGLAAPPVLVAGVLLVGVLTGLKWPVVESYVSAGRTPTETARSVGAFNLTWSLSVPLTLLVAGPLIELWSPGLFALAAAMNVVSLALMAPLPGRPTHLPHDHPERLSAVRLRRCAGLLISSRWSLLASYSMMWVLAALMPRILGGLGFSVAAATALAAVLDMSRGATFGVLHRGSWWHHRRRPLVLVVFGLPLGFFAVLFGRHLAVVLAGEVVFGISMGITYYAALYYAMIVKDASVEAGGGHEGLIGTGFAVGPAAGLVGRALEPVLGSLMLGRLLGLGSLVLICAVGALRALLRIGPPGEEDGAEPPAAADVEPANPLDGERDEEANL